MSISFGCSSYTSASIYSAPQSFNSQTGTSYIPVLADAGKMIMLSNADPVTLTVSADADVMFDIGTRIDLLQFGAGQVFITGDSGVTVVGTPSLQLRAQFSAATLIKINSDSWLLVGDMEA